MKLWSMQLALPAIAGVAFIFAAPRVATQQLVTHYGCQAPVKLDQDTADDLGHMGQSIAIGDFNNDGIQDVVLGGYDREDPTNLFDDKITKVYVFLGTGSLTGPLFRERLEIKGPQEMDLFGFAVAFIGDLDGDGCDELVVGSPRSDTQTMTDSGRVWVFYGRPAMIADISGSPDTEFAVATAAFTLDGAVNGGWFGASIATARNASGAFLKELLVGAPGNSVLSTTVRGSVYFYGATTMESASVVAGGTLG